MSECSPSVNGGADCANAAPQPRRRVAPASSPACRYGHGGHLVPDGRLRVRRTPPRGCPAAGATGGVRGQRAHGTRGRRRAAAHDRERAGALARLCGGAGPALRERARRQGEPDHGGAYHYERTARGTPRRPARLRGGQRRLLPVHAARCAHQPARGARCPALRSGPQAGIHLRWAPRLCHRYNRGAWCPSAWPGYSGRADGMEPPRPTAERNRRRPLGGSARYGRPHACPPPGAGGQRCRPSGTCAVESRWRGTLRGACGRAGGSTRHRRHPVAASRRTYVPRQPRAPRRYGAAVALAAHRAQHLGGGA